MRRVLNTAIFLLAILPVQAIASEITSAPAPIRPVHTYSIVARDPATGDLGVAVQSHWFSVGSLVPWARAGVGAVATQSFVDVRYGVEGLQLMEAGASAYQALGRLIEADPNAAVRQVGMIDARGDIAQHTGESCIEHAGHLRGDNFAVQANLMVRAGVPEAKGEAFRATPGALAERLLTLHNAYRHMNLGDHALEIRDVDAALSHYGLAQALAPENLEMRFWHAVSLVNAGRVDASLPLFVAIFRQDANWRVLVSRLAAAGLLTADSATVERILGVVPREDRP